MANFTAREQLMLELINRARMDPAGEAARYGIALNEGVPAGKTISTAAKQVLAGNDKLGLAADKHSSWMVANDLFAHDEVKDTPGFYAIKFDQRLTKAQYAWSSAGENIAAMYSSGTLNDTQTILDLHKALFVDENYPERGHRTNMMNASYKELGVGHKTGDWDGDDSSVITTDFGTSGSDTFVTGVVYDDTTTNDNFFTVGEETAALKVSGSGETDTTGAGGGYELAYASTGSKTITFDFAGTNTDLIVKLTLGSTNVKIDAVNGKEIWTNASLSSQSTAIKELHALGITKMNLSGSSTSEKIYGNKAVNKLDGNGGNDTISASSGADTLIGGTGNDSLTGGASTDAFVFDEALGSSNIDKITDFASGSDKIHLSAAIFAALGTSITTSEFHVRSSGHVADSSDHIIYDASNGTLWYDADDDGAGAAIQFATLTNKPATLSVSDFLVV